MYNDRSGEDQDYYYAHDMLYSPVALLNDDGTVAEYYEYDAYGRCNFLDSSFTELDPQASAKDNPYLFTGRRLDIMDSGSLKIMYYRARYYNTGTGRFLSRDPLGNMPDYYYKLLSVHADQYSDGMCLYLYTKANPINMVDPFGFESGSGGSGSGGSGSGCPCGEALTQIGAVGPIDAWTARRLANEARRVAAGTGLPGAHNGPRDAFRHCYWNCRMAQEIGADQAEEVGDIHERCGGGPADENAMDQHNNSVGRGLGTPGADCKSGCLGALRDGRLRPSP